MYKCISCGIFRIFFLLFFVIMEQLQIISILFIFFPWHFISFCWMRKLSKMRVSRKKMQGGKNDSHSDALAHLEGFAHN